MGQFPFAYISSINAVVVQVAILGDSRLLRKSIDHVGNGIYALLVWIVWLNQLGFSLTGNQLTMSGMAVSLQPETKTKKTYNQKLKPKLPEDERKETETKTQKT